MKYDLDVLFRYSTLAHSFHAAQKPKGIYNRIAVGRIRKLRTHYLGRKKYEFVILASDGLFDHVTPQEAVNFVRYSLLNNQNLQIAAQELSDLAIRRASVAADNVGILIVAFKQTERLDKH